MVLASLINIKDGSSAMTLPAIDNNNADTHFIISYTKSATVFTNYSVHTDTIPGLQAKIMLLFVL